MINLLLNHGLGHEGVYLRLPATPADIGSAFSMLDRLGTGAVSIFDVECPVPNIRQYILHADINDQDSLDKLQELAQRIATMDRKEQHTFSGALDNESINGIDDVLLVAKNLEGYVLLPNINTDADLGRFLVDTGFKDCPEDMQAYLDFGAIGRDFRTEYGGAFGSGGFVRRKNSFDLKEDADPIITLYMHTSLSKGTGELPYPLKLPATEQQLDRAKERMNIDEFSEATIVAIEFTPAYLVDNIPVDCPSVGTANDLAMELEHMMQRDGELLKFFSAIEVERPQTMAAALDLAMNMDNYERVPDDAYEYGQIVLGRGWPDDELLTVLDGYMDFARFGEDAMKEDGVRRTEYGLIRRCDDPFPEESQSMQMGGM